MRTAEHGSVAMECDVLPAAPHPEIEWFMNNGNTPLEENNDILFLEEGRFLFLHPLTAVQRGSSFYCKVVNALLDTSMPRRSPTTYTLDGSIPLNTLEFYYKDRSVTAIQGEQVRVVLAAAASLTNGFAATIALTCSEAVRKLPGVSVLVRDEVMAFFNGLTGQLNITCEIAVAGGFGGTLHTVTYSFTIERKYTSSVIKDHGGC